MSRYLPSEYETIPKPINAMCFTGEEGNAKSVLEWMNQYDHLNDGKTADIFYHKDTPLLHYGLRSTIRYVSQVCPIGTWVIQSPFSGKFSFVDPEEFEEKFRRKDISNG